MVTVLPASQVAYITAAIGIVTALMSGVAGALDMLPVMQQRPALFDWTVRAINAVLSVGMVCAAEATQGVFDLHNWLAYILVSGVVVAPGAHVLYTATTARIKTKLANITLPLATPVVAPVIASPPAAVPNDVANPS